jgi:hypothetical protein
MSWETLGVLVAAAAMFLVGVACSPLAWVALRWRRSRFEDYLLDRLGVLSRRIEELEARAPMAAEPGRDRNTRGERRGPPSLLISVPSLDSREADRSLGANQGLAERYAAVWRMADSGSSMEAISRETQTPIGQIELILGLRRSLQARTTFSHAAHPAPGREPA